MNLKEDLKLLALLRAKAYNLHAAKILAYRQFEDSISPLLKEMRDTDMEIIYMEGIIREHAVDSFRESGDKTPAPGLTVKIFQEIRYNPREAFAWAKEHSIALALEK